MPAALRQFAPAALRQFAPAALAGVAAGLVAVTVGPVAVLVLLVVVGLGVAGLMVRLRSTGATVPQFPVATLLAGVAVLLYAWIGVRGSGNHPVSELPFLAMLPLLVLPALRYKGIFPVPAWLLWVGGGLATSALLAAIFVPHPPPKILSVEAGIGTVSQGGSSLTSLARIEYSMVLVPIVLGALASSWRRARLFADLWLASAAICAAVACVDYFTGAGLADALGSVGPNAPAGQETRAAGLAYHSNYLGSFSAMALPLGVIRITQTSGLLRVCAAGATAVLGISVQLSGSRMGFVAACIGVAVLPILIPRFRTRLVLASTAFVSVAIILLFVVGPSDQSAVGRLLGDPLASKSTDIRFSVISESLTIALDHPLTGVGFSRIFDSHSAVVQFFQAGGIVALASFGLWGFCFGRLGTRLSRDPRMPAHTAELAAAMSAGLIGWLLTDFLNPQISERFFYLPCGVLLGLGLAVARLEPSPEPTAGELGRDVGPRPPVAAADLPRPPETQTRPPVAPVAR